MNLKGSVFRGKSRLFYEVGGLLCTILIYNLIIINIAKGYARERVENKTVTCQTGSENFWVTSSPSSLKKR
jgi:hypothetical protein